MGSCAFAEEVNACTAERPAKNFLTANGLLVARLQVNVAGRGNAKNAQGDHDGAFADCNEALKIEPKNSQALAFRGQAKNALGDHAGAVADYTEALKIEPENFQALARRGHAKKALGDHDGAVADCTEALKTAPKYYAALELRDEAKKTPEKGFWRRRLRIGKAVADGRTAP